MHIIQQEIGVPKINIKRIGDNHALFTVSPLPSGYGMTLGNAFRRVLLSSLPGAAVTGAKIRGTTHEYTALAGVKDDVLSMLLNLKRLAIRKHSKQPTILKLDIKGGSGEVTAKYIEQNADIEILNPDLVITTLDKKADLRMDIIVEKGVGYSPASERQGKTKEAGLILLDAMFSPVERVRYDVTSARVGQMTNLDKLEIEIKTNGSMTPEESVKFASNIIKTYFELFNIERNIIESDFITDPKKIAESESRASVASVQISDDITTVGKAPSTATEKYTPIETLQFTPRTLNALINGGIGSVEQLIKSSPSKIADLRGFGAKALEEVNEKLSAKNLKLESGEE